MAGNSSGKMGVVVGVAVGVLLAGGLAATPYYLPMFQGKSERTEAALSEQVEGLRRAVLALDEHLATIADVTAGRAESPEVTAKSDELFPSVVRAQLEDTAKLLRAAAEQDTQRGTAMTAAGKIQSGLPNAKAASSELRTRHIAAHTKVLNDAEAQVRSLSSAEGARDSLAAVRVQALIAYCKARISRNRAAFERWQARQYRDRALEMVDSISDLRIRVASAEARMPTEAMADVEERIQQAGRQLEALEKAEVALAAQVSERKQQAEALEREAADARIAMTSYQGKPGALPGEYETLSSKAREAEAQAMALVNGTLEGAVALQSETGAIEPPKYSGGTRRVGLRDLELQLAALTEQIETVKGIRTKLHAHLDDLKKSAQRLEADREASAEALSSLTQRSNELVSESAQHDEAARKAEEAALKAFADAGRLAKQAATLAATRAREAGTAASEGRTTPDECLSRVATEGDTEGTMHFLAAEIAYHTGLTHVARLRAAMDQAVATGVIEGKPVSVDEQVATEARKAARAQLAEAVTLFKKAGTAISKTKADAISGKNSLWQVQVGEAAVHMLLAIVAEGEDEALAEQKLAYDLLKEAGKGREQSPLLMPALDALEFLQQSPS
ncbi:MAG: hypothetical protein HRU71_00410 [Planctomycetia bacterium]|nr:MAG: hypothetical protein HRU71_00410 [Planctomycetia bacterium]